MSEKRDARQSLQDVFDSLPDLDGKWRELIEGAFAAEKSREISVPITCKACGEERKYIVQVPLPDFKDRARALDMLLTQAKGKPAETQRIDLNVHAARTRAELEQLSDAELALLANPPEVSSPPQEQLTDGK